MVKVKKTYNRSTQASQIAHLIYNPWALLYAPLLNLASALSNEGYSNVLYKGLHCIPESEANRNSLALNSFAKIHDIHYNQKLRRALAFFDTLIGTGLNDRIGIAFAIETRIKASVGFAIGYDSPGACMAWSCSRLKRLPYAIFSLELEENSVISKFERRAWGAAQFILTFDDQRAQLLQSQYELPESKFIVVPNSSIGNVKGEKSEFLKSHLSIGPDKKVVLLMGSLIDEHCVAEIMQAVEQWPPEFVLVLHGWGLSDTNRTLFESLKSNYPDRLFLSTGILPHDQRYKVICSADVGIISFTDRTINHRYAGASAGKLFDFCQAGVPVLVSALPGMRELVEGNSIGFTIGDFSAAGEMLHQLGRRQDEYRQNCHRFFENNEFSLRIKDAISKISFHYSGALLLRSPDADTNR